MADGILNILRGSLEIATTPIAWLVKPVTRGCITLVMGAPKIENNAGMKRVANQGIDLSQQFTQKTEITNFDRFKLLAVANDLHRKFDKSQSRGQDTNIALDEETNYLAVRRNFPADNISALTKYFSLFADPIKTPAVVPDEKQTNATELNAMARPA